jgi:hypothetical protein
VFQVLRDGAWHDIPSEWKQGRDYYLFSWLANVAGLCQHQDLHAGHSHSWLTAQEILSAERPQARANGVLDRKQYAAWDGKSEPKHYRADIVGRDIVVVDDLDFAGDVPPPHATHVRVHFDLLDKNLDYFIDEVRCLVNEHGPDVRVVFGSAS